MTPVAAISTVVPATVITAQPLHTHIGSSKPASQTKKSQTRQRSHEEILTAQAPKSKEPKLAAWALAEFWWPRAESNHRHADFQDKSLAMHRLA
ncbi:MAG: hypothetical protein KA538_10490 [Azonexus sp.]|nr:hypothetical protein [Azonexus sp.]